jgi:hypothetical protein
VIDVEQWAEIRRLHFAERMPIKAIVRQLGLSRNTVRAAIRSDAPPRYERAPAGSAVDGVEPQIRQLLKATPDMPVTVIAERIGWKRGMTVLRDRVRELRPAYLLPEGYGRTTYEPGELAQWDLWFPEDLQVPVGFGQTAVLPVIVGVACYSRWITARMIASKDRYDVLGGHLWCVRDLGRVPRKGVSPRRRHVCARAGRSARRCIARRHVCARAGRSAPPRVARRHVCAGGGGVGPIPADGSLVRTNGRGARLPVVCCSRARHGGSDAVWPACERAAGRLRPRRGPGVAVGGWSRPEQRRR